MIPFLITALLFSINCIAMENMVLDSTKTDSEQKQKKIAAKEAWLKVVAQTDHSCLLDSMQICNANYLKLILAAKTGKFAKAFNNMSTEIAARITQVKTELESNSEPSDCVKSRAQFQQICNLEKWHTALKEVVEKKLNKLLVEENVTMDEFNQFTASNRERIEEVAILESGEYLVNSCNKMYKKTQKLFIDAAQASKEVVRKEITNKMTDRSTPERAVELTSLLLISSAPRSAFHGQNSSGSPECIQM